MIFPALCLGGTLHLMSQQHIGDAAAFGDYCQSQGLDCLKITPSHLAALVNQAHPERVLPARKLVLGGEATPAELVLGIQRMAPDLQIYNHYGPSETTVGVLTHLHSGQIRSFPLGAPLPNTRVFVLNAGLEPVPIGVSGELFISGDGVARGYLALPHLTAERFLPDPFSEDPPGQRMYRTGDLVHRLSGGALEFLGRVDFQIKIRGYRVELGEIDHVLVTHPQVREAVTLLWKNESEQETLLSYVVPKDEHIEETSTREKIRQYILERLPGYMAPTHYLFLEKLPLTPNGKVDRQALSRPDMAKYGRLLTGRDTVCTPPTNETEERLVAIWSEILKVDSISTTDNFFSLGGHSLNGTIILSRIQDEFSSSLRLVTLSKNQRSRIWPDIFISRSSAKRGTILRTITWPASILMMKHFSRKCSNTEASKRQDKRFPNFPVGKAR